MLVPLTLTGQPSHGYVSAGLGSYRNKLNSQYALGGEWGIGKGLGVGAELGVLAGHTSFIALSANGYYHLPVASSNR